MKLFFIKTFFIPLKFQISKKIFEYASSLCKIATKSALGFFYQKRVTNVNFSSEHQKYKFMRLFCICDSYQKRFQKRKRWFFKDIKSYFILSFSLAFLFFRTLHTLCWSFTTMYCLFWNCIHTIHCSWLYVFYNKIKRLKFYFKTCAIFHHLTHFIVIIF